MKIFLLGIVSLFINIFLYIGEIRITNWECWAINVLVGIVYAIGCSAISEE